MTIKKNDFVEIEFTGKITGTDEIFDTNIKADAEKAGLDIKTVKPFALSVGNQMLPKGLDEDLEGVVAEQGFKNVHCGPAGHPVAQTFHQRPDRVGAQVAHLGFDALDLLR